MHSEENDLQVPNISPNLCEESHSTESRCPSHHSFKASILEGPTAKQLQAQENQIRLFYLSENHIYPFQ